MLFASTAAFVPVALISTPNHSKHLFLEFAFSPRDLYYRGQNNNNNNNNDDNILLMKRLM